MMFVAPAPAPLIPPLNRPPAMAAEAANARLVIVADSVASRSIPPVVAVTPASAFRVYASTRFRIVFRASATPTETAPAIGPNPPPSAAVPTSALIVEVSSAKRRTDPAVMPSVPSPSMNAAVVTAIQLSALEPAPVAPIPTAPVATATEPETTIAAIVWCEVAVSVSAPVAWTLESSRYARTSTGCRDRTSRHRVVSV